ncbi:MAG: ThuA domain-containing protein [Acidobacteria bacterium]|nr:ThuA domain-containing protein [Acidobacteriota bacterium]
MPGPINKTVLVAAAFATTVWGRRIELIAGPPSHGPLAHEHNAGVLIFEKWLNRVPGIQARAHLNGWPADPAIIEAADAVFVFCDGSEKHLMFQPGREELVSKAVKRGMGLVLYHYAVEPPAQRGHQEMLNWTGGFFELRYSVNPVWEASFERLPHHPVTRGVQPFRIRDEWYFNMRFRDGMAGITPILTAVPPAALSERPDGLRSGNADVRAKSGQPHTVMWAFERPGGGRGVGFTGGHMHLNLGDPNFRKVVLNAIVWAAGGEVPAGGVPSEVSKDDLMANLDPKPARK